MMDCLPNSGGPRIVGGDSASMLLQMVLTAFIHDLAGFCHIYLSSKLRYLKYIHCFLMAGGGGGGSY